MGLNSVEIVMEVEDEFDISIPDPDAERIMRVGELAEYVFAAMGGDQNSKGLSRDDVLQKIRTIVSEQMVMPIDQITAEKHFVRDLHIN